MDARITFEWNGEKAKKCVAQILTDSELVPDLTVREMVNRDDSEYEVTVAIRLKHKRKSRKKNAAPHE